MKRSTFIKTLLSGIASLFTIPFLFLAEKNKEEKLEIEWEKSSLKIRLKETGEYEMSVSDNVKSGEYEYLEVKWEDRPNEKVVGRKL